MRARPTLISNLVRHWLPIPNYLFFGHLLTCWRGVANDEKEAIDRSNIINERTRHAKPQTDNGYNEGPSEDDLP